MLARATIVTALLLTLGGAAPSHAADQMVFATTVKGTDVTDYAIRSGPIGDRCSSWTKLDGRVVTTLSATKGTMTIVEPPRGPVGPIMTHTLEKTRMTVRLKTTGTRHEMFPCGCGPNSELGACPPEQADTPLNGSCKQSGPQAGLLGLTQKKLRLWAIVSGPLESLLEQCAFGEHDLLPREFGLSDELPLDKRALWDLRKMKVGRTKTLTSEVEHEGNGWCLVAPSDATRACGTQTFTLRATRTK